MSGAGNYRRTDSAVPQSAAGAGPRSSTGLGEWRGWGPWGRGVKYRMLHIPGILDCTYHLHVSCLCAQGSSCKKRHLRACVPVRFARVHTPKLHLNVVAELPGIPGVLHTCEGDRSISSGILRISEENRRKQIPGLVPRTAQWLAYLQR